MAYDGWSSKAGGGGGVVRVTQVMTVARVVKVTTIVLNKLAFNPLNASNIFIRTYKYIECIYRHTSSIKLCFLSPGRSQVFYRGRLKGPGRH